MSLLKKIRRAIKRMRTTASFSVHTRNHKGEHFHYAIRLCAARNRTGSRERVLVRFDRTGPQGNTFREHRVMTTEKARSLRFASC